jgi:hypothetical protein
MDPTFYGLRLYNSFERPKPIFDSETMLPPSFSVDVDDLLPINNIQLERISSPHERIERKYISSTSSTSYTSSISLLIRERSRYDIVLSNVDAIYKLTGFYGGLVKPRIETPEFTFLIMNDPSFEMTKYLQYRLTNPKGIVYETVGNEEDINNALDSVSTTYLTPIINYQEESYFSFLNEFEAKVMPVFKTTMLGEGVEFVVSGPPKIIKDLIPREDIHADYLQYLSCFYLLQQLVVCLKTCNKGGNYMAIIYGSTSEFMAETIYLVAQCFESIQILKPLSTNPYAKERILIGLSRKSNEIIVPYQNKIEHILRQNNLLSSISIRSETNNPLWVEGINKSSQGEDVSKYFSIQHVLKSKKLPKSFQKFLTKTNNDIQQYQKDYEKDILKENNYMRKSINKDEKLLWSTYNYEIKV